MAEEANYTKFLKFFTTRLVQTLVQARLGSKIEQPCNGQPEQPDWFNMRVDELGEIAAYLRTALQEYPPACESVSIEFLLYTADGIYLPLESWVMSVDDEKQPNISTEFYHQLGTLLRSAAAAARVTPMYRYFVKKQGQDTFVILYRIFKGSMPAELGKNSKEVSIGALPSPVGTVHLDLIYRTDMTIPEASLPVKSSERPDKAALVSQRKSLHTDELPCRPSFSDCIPVSGGQPEESIQSPAYPSFTAESPIRSPSPEPKTRFRIGRSSSSEESIQSLHHSTSDDNKECIFAPQKIQRLPHSESFPFASLLLSSPTKRYSTQSETVFPIETRVEIQEASPVTSDKSEKQGSSENTQETGDSEDEKDEIEINQSVLKVFGQSTNNVTPNTLSEFIKDCRTAPVNLEGFYSESPESLQSQLASFISKEKEFIAFIKEVRESSIDDE